MGRSTCAWPGPARSILAAFESRYRGTRVLGEPGLNLTGFLSRKKVIEANKPRQMAIQVRPAAIFFASICARKADHACELRIPKLLLNFRPESSSKPLTV